MPRVTTTWLTIIEVAYLLTISVWVVLERRRPLATWAWLLVLALLPVVGLPVYYFLGPRRLSRQRARRRRALQQRRAAHPGDAREADIDQSTAGIDERWRSLARLAWNHGAESVTSGNAIELLHSGLDCYAQLSHDIARARHHIHLEYYIFEQDATGRLLCDQLVSMARQGIKVRLLVDGVGSPGVERRFLQPLREAGGEVAVFHPVRVPRLRPVNFRNHRKIVVIDGHIGFTGGMNIGTEYMGIGPLGDWRDLHLRMEGPATTGLQRLFLEDWAYATGHSVGGREYMSAPASPAGRHAVQVLGSGPDGDWNGMHQLYLASLGLARERVQILTPYFVPDEPLLEALCTASLRGVLVELLTAGRTDARLVRAAGRSYIDTLLAAGVHMAEMDDAFIHAKAVVVDEAFAIIGSANCDNRSLRLNFEVAALLYDAELARQVSQRCSDEWRRSRRLSEQAHSPWYRRLVQAGARVLGPLL